MIISLELKQEWRTAQETLAYFRLLARTLERVCEMEAEAPADWYFRITEQGDEEHNIELTHL